MKEQVTNTHIFPKVDELQSVFDDLETLSRDSAKFRAKRDRKQQRASFREILGCVMDNGEFSRVCF